MKINLQKILALGLIALVGLSISSPAQARWYDGHYYHHGHPPGGWVWDPRLHYYVYGAPVVMAPPPGAVVIAQPAPVVVAPPQPVYVAPAPAYVAPAPVGINLGVHIH